jgi:hypothetical protein
MLFELEDLWKSSLRREMSKFKYTCKDGMAAQAR